MAIIGPDAKGRYRLDWRGPDRVRRRELLVAQPYADVVRAHAARLAGLGQTTDRRPRITVSAICQRYLALHDVYARHPLSDDGRIRAVGIAGSLAADPLGQIAPSAMRPAEFVREVIAWRARRYATGLAAGTLDREYNLLRAALSMATATGEIDQMPIPRGAVRRLVSPQDGRVVYFEPWEWRAFIGGSKVDPGAAGGSIADLLAEFRPLFVALLWTVSRLSEIRLLRWVDVDLRAGSLRIPQGKTGGRAKTVPIADELRADLEARAARGVTPDSLVFPAADGQAHSRHAVQRAFATYRDRAGLRRELTPHSLRHTALSWMGIAGESPQAMQRLAGHATLAMTMRYVHMRPEHLRGGLDAIRSTMASGGDR